MKLMRRCTLRGAIKYILPITLLILVVICFIWLCNINKQLKEDNDALTSTIEGLEAEKDNLNTRILQLEAEKQSFEEERHGFEEERQQLQLKIDDLKRIQKKLIQQNSSLGTFKSYTDYKCLARNSAQWKLQERAYTDENGLRKIGDAYMVALGSYYGTTLGTRYTVTLSNGNVFQIVLCDFKKNIHTDANNQKTLSDGSVLEFYVDTSALPKSVKTSGTISSIKYFSGSVVSIVRN